MVAVLLLILFAYSSTANGDNCPNCPFSKGCVPDNYEHTYCYGANMAGNGLQNAAGYSMSNFVTQTNYSKTYMNSCTNSTDVVFKRNDSMSGKRGRYTCMLPRSGADYICLRARVELNSTLLANTLNKNKTACHEVGHSGGLIHGKPNDCMVSGTVYSGHIHYTNHHVKHMNKRQ